MSTDGAESPRPDEQTPGLAELSELVHSVPGVVYQFRVGPDGAWSFPFVSQRAKEFFGLDPSDAMRDAQTLIARIVPEDAAHLPESVERSRSTLEPWITEFRALDAQGCLRWILGWSVPRRLPDGSTLWSGTLTDITPQATLRQQLASAVDELTSAQRRIDEQTLELERLLDAANTASRAKSEFLAHMSHEIRTPMTAIVGFTDILLEPMSGPDAVKRRLDAAGRIKSNGEHLLQLISDLLDISSIEAGKAQIERQPCDLLNIVQEIRAAIEPLARAKGLGLSIALRTPVPRIIHTDPARLRQILLKLADNAVKFTPQGAVVIGVAFQPLPLPSLIFEVRDTGVGIGQTDLAKLFQPFSQLDSKMSRKFGGTGLGLALSQRLAQMLGGRITAASEEGRGSVFTLTIDPGPIDPATLTSEMPADRAPPVPPAPSLPEGPPADASSPHLLDGRRILVVEDGPDNRRLIGFHLSKAGAQVDFAENGADGIIQLERAIERGAPPDLVIMDMQMPVMDGYAATKEIRSMGLGLPIMALTAHTMSGDRERCLATGCDEYQTKPINAKAFVTLARELIERSLLQAAAA